MSEMDTDRKKLKGMRDFRLRQWFEKDADRVCFFEWLPRGYHHYKRLNVLLKTLQKIAVQSNVILDVGCGDGWHDLHIVKLGYSVVGLDIPVKRIRRARKLVKAEFVVGDATKMRFEDKLFDIVICAEPPLEHVPEPLDDGVFFLSRQE